MKNNLNRKYISGQDYCIPVANPAVQVISLRPPVAEDGAVINRLVTECPPLDSNSVYCNLLQCTHFAATSVVAESEGTLVGFATAYLLPGRVDTLFVWQIAVSAAARGRGLANSMLRHILLRPVCAEVSCIEASVAPDNTASRQLFLNLAEAIDGRCDESLLFGRDRHFNGKHPDEKLLRIRPDYGSVAFNLMSKREVFP